MSQSIGSLVIKLEAQTAALRTDMAEARRIIDQNTNTMQRAFSGVQSAARGAAAAVGAIGASLGIGAFVSYARQVIDTVGALGEMADQLGVTTDGLQALQFQALQSGASVETLEGGLAKFTRSVGDAAEGNDALLDRFKALGVGILDGNGKLRASEAILGDVAQALSRIDDPAKQAAAVVDLFGKSGQKLLPLLKDLSEVGIDGLIGRAREAGAVVDSELIKRFDTLSDSAAMLGKRLTVGVADGLDKIITSVNNLDASKAALLGALIGAGTGARIAGLPGALVGGAAGASFGASIAPGASQAQESEALRQQEMRLIDELYAERTGPNRIQVIAALQRSLNDAQSRRIELGNAMSQARSGSAVGAGGAVSAATNAGPTSNPASTRDLQGIIAGDNLVRQLANTRDSLNLTQAAQLRLRLEREMDSRVVNGQIVTEQRYSAATINAAVAIQSQIDATEDLRRRQLDASATAAALSAEREKEAAASAAFRGGQALAAQKVAESIAQTRTQTDLTRQATIVWNKYTQQFELVNEQLDLYLAKQRLIAANPTMKPGDVDRLAQDEVAAAKSLKDATDAQNASLQRQQATYDFVANAGERAFDRVGDAMAQMAVEGGKAFASLQNVAAGVVASIYADFMKLAIANPLKNAIFGGNAPTLSDAGGLFGKLFGGGQASGGPVDAASGLVGLTGVSYGGPRAAGGPVEPGKAYLVGEKGREIVQFGASGRVYPADETQAMLSGSAANSNRPVSVVVNVHESPGGATASVQQSQGPDGGATIDIYIDDRIDQRLARRMGNGSMDKMLGSNYGLARKPFVRS